MALFDPTTLIFDNELLNEFGYSDIKYCKGKIFPLLNMGLVKGFKRKNVLSVKKYPGV